MAYTRSKIRPGLLLGTAVSVGLPAAVQAQDGAEWDGQVEFNVIESDLNYDDGEGLDSSGFGARALAGVEFDLSDTLSVRAEGEARGFEFADEERGTRTSYGGNVAVEKQVGETVSLSLEARNMQNVGVLEATSADETAVRGQVQWERGNDRVRVNAEYREREYDSTAAGTSDGYRLYGQYRRRFGPYNWAYAAVRHEDMRSADEPRRSHERQVVELKYSHPVAQRVRILPSLEYRVWRYDDRVARGDPEGDLRKDRYVAPGLEVAWGRDSGGFYGAAGGEYRFRHSNDERYDEDAIRLEARLGYRF